MTNKWILFLGCLMLMLACKKKTLDVEAYKQYVNNEENGLIQTQTFGDFSISAKYRPTEYEVLCSLEPEELTEENMKQQVEENKKQLYFLLSLSSRDKKTDALTIGIQHNQQYHERVQYLIGGIQHDVRLIDGTDTLPCVMHHYERTYRLGDTHNVLLVFEPKQTEIQQDKTLLFNDTQLGMGKTYFNFSKKHLYQLPQLIL